MLVYLFSLSLPCRLRVGHGGGGGPRGRGTKICEQGCLSECGRVEAASCLSSQKLKKKKEKQNVPRLCVVICVMHVEWKCWNMQYEEKAAD